MGDAKRKKRWIYLEYTTTTEPVKFKGSIITESNHVAKAIRSALNKGIAPRITCNVNGGFVPENELYKIPVSFRNRLLTLTEVQQIWPEAGSDEELVAAKDF